MRNGEDIVNKKAETSVDYLECLKHEKELVFGPKKFLGDDLNLSPISKFLQSDGVTTFVKKLSL